MIMNGPSQRFFVHLLVIVIVVHRALAWTLPGGSEPLFVSRQGFLQQSTSVLLSSAAVPPLRPIDVGGGIDLKEPPPRSQAQDVVFPKSMEGQWTCQRVVTSVDGDKFMAESVWKALGGGGGGRKLTDTERFSTKFIPFTLNDELYTVVDREYEMAARTGSSKVEWIQQPNQLQYDNVQLSVVRRTIEVPSDQGFGFQELVSIQDGIFERAALVKRRYRRAFDDSGKRVVEGLEIVKTFRVMDGVAGTEFPTSTTKAQIRLTDGPEK